MPPTHTDAIADAPFMPRQTPSHRLAVGLALAAFPLLIQIPFALLAARFDYPDILRRPAAEVLERFVAGGARLVLTWYAYALCVVPFLATVIALPGTLAAGPTRSRLLLAFGSISAVTQLLGLLRWTLVVPALARSYVAPGQSEAARAALAVAFETQHRLFGILLGEHVGQMTLAIWTLLVAGTQSGVRRWLGTAAAGLFLVGLGDGLATVLDIPAAGVITRLPLIAFVTWTLWAVQSGIALARRALRDLGGRDAARS